MKAEIIESSFAVVWAELEGSQLAGRVFVQCDIDPYPEGESGTEYSATLNKAWVQVLETSGDLTTEAIIADSAIVPLHMLAGLDVEAAVVAAWEKRKQDQAEDYADGRGDYLMECRRDAA